MVSSLLFIEERDSAADDVVDATSLGDLLRGFMISSIPRTEGEPEASNDGRSISVVGGVALP